MRISIHPANIQSFGLPSWRQAASLSACFRITSRRAACACSASRKQSAFTLLELVISMAIAAVVMGLGIGSYMMMARSLSYNAASMAIHGQLMAARNTAIHEHAESFVLLDARENRIRSFGRVSRGFWHFDDGPVGTPFQETAGAFKQIGYMKNGTGVSKTGTLVEGRIGATFPFPGPNAADNDKLYIECGKSPAYVPVYNTAEGIALQAWVYAEEDSNDSPLPDQTVLPVIAKIGKPEDQLAPYGLFLKYDSDENKFTAIALVTLGTSDSSQVKEIEPDTAVIRPRVWTHVSMTYTNGGQGLRLSVNGILRESATSSTGPLLLTDQPVHIGHTSDTKRGSGTAISEAFFNGKIDEAIISVYQTSSSETIPEKVSIVVVNPKETETDVNYGNYTIYFDAKGQLDRQQHSSLPELLVLSPIITWDPEPHTIYNSLDDVNNFRSKHFATEAKREELAEKNQIRRLKLTWAGTVE